MSTTAGRYWRKLRAHAAAIHYFVLANVICVAGFLRLTGLNRQSLWFDEADVVVRAQRPLLDVLTTFTAAGENGPLYNILLAIWIRFAGVSEIAVRFPSAVAGVLAIPAIYILARRLHSPTTGLLAASLLAISPYHIWYSQEAKMYSMVVLLAILSTLLLHESLHRSGRGWWAGYIIVTSLMFYTHVATILVFAAQGLAVLITWDRWRSRRAGILWSAALLMLPYIPIALWAMRVIGGGVTTWQPDVSIIEAFDIVGVKFAANRADQEIETQSALLYLLIAGIGFIWLVVRRKTWTYSSLLFLAVVPIVGLYLVSLRNSVFSDRYIIVALPPYLILIAIALRNLIRARWVWPVSLVAMTAIVVLAWSPISDVNRSTSAEKEDWRSAYARIAERAEPGDVILPHPGYIVTTLTYYSQRESRLGQYPVATIPTFSVNWLTEEIMIDLLRIDVAPRDRFWLVQSPDRVPAEDPDNTLERWLDRTGEVLYEESLNGVEITLYDLPERWWEIDSALIVR